MQASLSVSLRQSYGSYVVGDERGAYLVERQAAVLFRDIGGGESQIGGLAQQRLHHAGFFRFDGRGAGQNVLAPKAGCCCYDLALLLAEVFRSEDLSLGMRDSVRKLPPAAAAMGNRAVVDIGFGASSNKAMARRSQIPGQPH